MPIADLGAELVADLLDSLFHLRWMKRVGPAPEWHLHHDHPTCWAALSAPMILRSGSYSLELPVGGSCLLPPGHALLLQHEPRPGNLAFGFVLRHPDQSAPCLARFNLPQVVPLRVADSWRKRLASYAEAEREDRAARLAVRPICEEFLLHHLADGVAQGIYQPARGAVPDWLRVARDRLEHHPPSQHLKMTDLARELGVSPAWFDRRFRAAYGTTPSACRRRAVLRDAAQRLTANPELSISEVAALHGYASQAAFARAFRATFGLSPGQHRRR